MRQNGYSPTKIRAIRIFFMILKSGVKSFARATLAITFSMFSISHPRKSKDGE